VTKTERAAVVRALEALKDGNADEARAFLESALCQRPRPRCVCPECGVGFEWAGLLDPHLRLAHPDLWEKTDAA
jgi:hypothetical protein